MDVLNDETKSLLAILCLFVIAGIIHHLMLHPSWMPEWMVMGTYGTLCAMLDNIPVQAPEQGVEPAAPSEALPVLEITFSGNVSDGVNNYTINAEGIGNFKPGSLLSLSDTPDNDIVHGDIHDDSYDFG